MYGYYAKVSVNNLIFWGQIHRELADAVRDHILLSKILEHIRCSDDGGNFPSRVSSAVTSVLAAEGLCESSNFLRTVTVRFSAQHWIGCGLSIHYSGLEKALNAWQRLHVARGVPLFVGGHTARAYTPERAEQQWRHLRDVFIDLQTENGRRDGQRMRRSDVESRLASLEASYRSTFVKKVADCGRRRARRAFALNAEKMDPHIALLRRFHRVLRMWERKTASAEQQQKRVEAQRRKKQAELNQKRRWDGKESLENFKRRVLAQTLS